MKIKFTILGATGFIGSHLVKFLRNKDIECYAPDVRNDDIFNDYLGNVIYAIGVSDFLNRPFTTVDAHVCILRKLLEKSQFDSFVYLSSGRPYYQSDSTHEDDELRVNPSNPNDLYNISKLMGESLCINCGKENIKIVRPSNVVGIGSPPNLFIPSIIHDAVYEKKITLHSTLDSEKDYVYITDVVNILFEISIKGKPDIYNIAMGKNTKSKEIIDEILNLTGCDIEISKNAKRFSSPLISIDKLNTQFGFKPSSIVDKLDEIVSHYQQEKISFNSKD